MENGDEVGRCGSRGERQLLFYNLPRRKVWVKFRAKSDVIPLVYVWEVRGRLCRTVCIIARA
jgi:hypothetical protein